MKSKLLVSILVAASCCTLPLIPAKAQSVAIPSAEDVLFDLDSVSLQAASVPDDSSFTQILAFDGAGPVSALPIGPGGDKPVVIMRRGCRESMFAGLNLTDSQYEQLFAIKKSSMTKNAGKAAEMIAAQMDLHDQLLRPEIDKAKATALQSRIDSLRTEIANQHFQDQLAIMNVLTADQRAELRRSMLKRMAGGFGGPHMMGGPHQGMPGPHPGPEGACEHP